MGRASRRKRERRKLTKEQELVFKTVEKACLALTELLTEAEKEETDKDKIFELFKGKILEQKKELFSGLNIVFADNPTK